MWLRQTDFFLQKDGVNRIGVRYKIGAQLDWKSPKRVIIAEPPYHAQVWESPSPPIRVLHLSWSLSVSRFQYNISCQSGSTALLGDETEITFGNFFRGGYLLVKILYLGSGHFITRGVRWMISWGGGLNVFVYLSNGSGNLYCMKMGYWFFFLNFLISNAILEVLKIFRARLVCWSVFMGYQPVILVINSQSF